MLTLIKTHINELQIADILGKYYCFRTHREVHHMIALYIIESIDKLRAHLLDMFRPRLTRINKLTQRIAINIVGDDT